MIWLPSRIVHVLIILDIYRQKITFVVPGLPGCMNGMTERGWGCKGLQAKLNQACVHMQTCELVNNLCADDGVFVGFASFGW